MSSNRPGREHLSAHNFYGLKFRLLTKSQFPQSLTSLVIEAPHPLFPFIPSFAHTDRQDEQDGFRIMINSTRQAKKTTRVHHRTLAGYICISIAKGFDVLLRYDSPLRFSSKSNSSGSTSTIGIAAGSPPKSSSILARHKFIKRAILIISTPTATSVYTCLVISAHDIPGLTRGNTNAWCIAWGKSGGKTLANPAVLTRFWRNAM